MDNIEDIMFAQRLADNEKSVRDKAIKGVRKYIQSNQGLSESSMMKLWKGLYYCMYMADKPLVQEDLAECTSLLLHECSSNSEKILFFKCALQTFSREWEGIDHFRINKFMMLMCRILRQMLVHLRNLDWNDEEMSAVVTTLESIVICPSDNINSKPIGMKIHLSDIIMEELAKIGKEDLPHKVILSFLYPYIKVLLLSSNKTYVENVKKHIFYWLIEQCGTVQREKEEGIESDEEQMEESGGEEEEDSDEQSDEEVDTETALDPRAGGVDVVLPQLSPDFNKIADVFLAMGSIPSVNAKKRKGMYKMVEDFRAVAQDINPLEESDPLVIRPYKETKCKMTKKALIRLQNFEEALMSHEELGKRKKKNLKPNCTKRTLEEIEEDEKDDPSLNFPKTQKNKKKMIIKKRTKPIYKQKKNITEVLRNNLANEIDLKMKFIAPKVDISLNFSEVKLQDKLDPPKKKKLKVYQQIIVKKDSSASNTNLDYSIHTKNQYELNMKKTKVKIPCLKTPKHLKKHDLKSTDKILAPESIKTSSKSNEIPLKSTPKITKAKVASQKKKAEPRLKETMRRQMFKSTTSEKTITLDKGPVAFNGNKLEQSDAKLNHLTEAKQCKKMKILKDTKKSKFENKKLTMGQQKTKNKKVLNSRTAKGTKKKLAQKSVAQLWEEPLKEGEVEIVISKKAKKLQTGRGSTLFTPLSQLPIRKTSNSSGKMLAFNLERNKEHDIQHYRKMINDHPQIPFSAVKKPKESVLKSPMGNASLQKPLKASPLAITRAKKRRKIHKK